MNTKTLISNWKWPIVGLTFLLILGFAIRIYNLTILPIFVDEAIYVRWSQVMAAEPTLRFLPLSDGKQPLYMWILMFVIKYFSDPLFVGRLISVLTGLVTSLGIFTFSYMLFKNKLAAIFSSFLYVISPFAIFFDRMALVDSMLSMFTIWTTVFGYLTAKYRRLDLALITGFLLGFAALTKSPALFVAILLPSFWLLGNWPKDNKKVMAWLIKSVFLSIVTYILAMAMYNIQRLGPNFALLSSRTKDYVLPISHIWSNFLDPLIPHLKDFLTWVWHMGPASLFLLILVGIYVGFRKDVNKVLVLLLWIVLPVVVQSELGIVFTARYVFFTLPFLFIIAGISLLNNSRILTKILVAFILIFVFQSVKFDYLLLTNPEKANLPRGERSGYLEEWTAGHGIKEIAEYLRREESKNPGKQIVVGTEGFFGTLPDGLQLYLNDLPNIKVIGVGVVIDDTPLSLKAAVEAGNKTYLVINKSRFNGDAEEDGYVLIQSFPKALRLTDSQQYARYGEREELRFYELKKGVYSR